MAEGDLHVVSNQSPDSRIAWEGCSVLLDINDGDRLVFARLSPASTLKVGNKKCSLRPLIGCPFGSLFQVDNGPKGPFLSLVPANSDGNTPEENEKEKDESQPKEETRDNRALIDNNSAQRLSGEDIDAMRREGASGDQIIEALISNSLTFGKKTAFSQEKYRQKKQKKYAPRVLMRRPFSRSICEAYFKKYPAKIGFLRVDTLSLLISLANVSAYSDVLVLDMVGGMVTGVVAERLGGTGTVCNTYFGVTPYPMDIVRMFNLSAEICCRILQSPLSELSATQENISEPPIVDEKARSSEPESNGESASFMEGDSSHSLCEPMGTSPTTENGQQMDISSTDKIDAISEENFSPFRRASKASKPGRPASQETVELWKKNGFTSLIIAAPELDTWTILQELLPLISYSAPFAIYHQYLQPLAICMHNLQASRMAIGLQISEPWLREYQVLPCRTHPLMQMSAFGGYILSGIRVCNRSEAQ
ncbi:hypothetical protein H6P81_018856 [Aristolochia fimbriata]|uniref:tRNA (adenine(58)-N(1))-methyltransferase non-catalytic subunit TRM6 n=1 Tax=Aristolochia fimbriata TaxID=158543 RepID=A0AAV7E2G0_ARIFI|nr:hypothetical protein H6P81_018856 [Aristolochia fimbriata]